MTDEHKNNTKGVRTPPISLLGIPLLREENLLLRTKLLVLFVVPIVRLFIRTCAL